LSCVLIFFSSFRNIVLSSAFYIIMERLTPLNEYLEKIKKKADLTETEEDVDLMTAIANTFNAVRVVCGIHHMDVKPANLLVREDDGQLKIAIIDFGSTLCGSVPLPQVHGMLGNIQYAPLECLLGGDKTLLWSAGDTASLAWIFLEISLAPATWEDFLKIESPAELRSQLCLFFLEKRKHLSLHHREDPETRRRFFNCISDHVYRWFVLMFSPRDDGSEDQPEMLKAIELLWGLGNLVTKVTDTEQFKRDVEEFSLVTGERTSELRKGKTAFTFLLRMMLCPFPTLRCTMLEVVNILEVYRKERENE